MVVVQGCLAFRSQQIDSAGIVRQPKRDALDRLGKSSPGDNQYFNRRCCSMRVVGVMDAAQLLSSSDKT